MPKKDHADQCVTVRLPQGVADELRAATGQPISALLRFVAVQLLEQKRAERTGTGFRTVHQAIDADISNIVIEGPKND